MGRIFTSPPDDPFRIVFVCAMWLTGFDAPSCSTLYLDKPMRNHTLMQTIARANRMFRDKVNGLIVDYVGVFRNLQKALAIYGAGSGGKTRGGDTPVEDKAAVFASLAKHMSDNGISLESIVQRPGQNGANGNGDRKTVILVTHATMEISVRHAVEAISSDGYLIDKPQVIRIERTEG